MLAPNTGPSPINEFRRFLGGCSLAASASCKCCQCMAPEDNKGEGEGPRPLSCWMAGEAWPEEVKEEEREL
jgi:hypothetical protein